MIEDLGSAEALPKGRRRPRERPLVPGSEPGPVMITVAGEPQLRRTVAVAAEHPWLALVAQLRDANEERHA